MPAAVQVQVRGAAAQALESRESELLVSGPAGTGKTIACLWKLHAAALKYPGMRGLMLRKTGTSLTASALVSFQRYILASGSYGVRFFGGSKLKPAQFEYPNGSVIVVGGMDKADKILSTEYDLCYINEATELTIEDWESITSRMRNGGMPYQQMLADCNPGPPTHWLYQRAMAGTTRILYSRHEDNPAYYDPKTRTWTEAGQRYLTRLGSLTGVRRARFLEGRWVAAEGVVYDGWNPAIHIIDRFDIPPAWPKYRVIDFGFTNPFVCQWWAVDPDGRAYRYRELYLTRRLVEDHCATIKRVESDIERRTIVATITDHDAEDRATFERHMGQKTTGANKAVSSGIQTVAERLTVQPDGKPRLFFLRGALVERDQELASGAKPTCTEEEFESYVWDVGNGRKKGDQPKKEDDHGMDATRYLVQHLTRPRADVAPAVLVSPSVWR
jgi:phage terminase large subunit